MSPRERRGNGWAWLAVLVGITATMGAMSGVTDHIGAASIPIWGIVLGTGAVILRGPIGKALADQLRGGSDREEPTEVPEEVYAELDDLRARLSELEERQDFSERLLAQQRQQQEPAR
jgi:hypothetical protein